MFKNYLKTAGRNLLRQRGYSSINVAGLTLGFTCCFLIFQFVAFEYSFDRFHEHADRLYRVVQTTTQKGQDPELSGLSGYALGPSLVQDVPEVQQFTRTHPSYNPAVISNPSRPELVFEENDVFYADPAFTQMFTLPLIAGDTTGALSQPHTMLISESAARKFFGAENAVGRELSVTSWIQGSYRISGVFRDLPAGSHLKVHYLLPMIDLLGSEQYRDPESAWGWQNFITYIQLRPGVQPESVISKLTAVLLKYRGAQFEDAGTKASLSAQNVLDIHLDNRVFAPNVVQGSYRTVYFFTIIGLVTLMIALVNYVNLATARAMDRAREVGVRKVVGAARRQLVIQFLFESALTNLLALFLAVVIAATVRPVIGDMTGVQPDISIWKNPWFWLAFSATFVTGTLLSGLYPAFVLSSFRPISILKGKSGSYSGRFWLRRGLVVLQFSASIILVIGTFVVYGQLNYMKSMDLGMNLEQILTIAGPRVLDESVDVGTARQTFIRELKRIPAVRQVATSSSLPGQGFNWYTSGVRKATADPTTGIDGVVTRIDSSFAGLYGLQLVAGQSFERFTRPSAEGEPMKVIANETAVKALGFGSPLESVDQLIDIGGQNAEIVGVFKDFNWSSAHQKRENAFFSYIPAGGQFSVRVSPGQLPRTITSIQQVYTSLFPGNPFRYAFLDETFNRQYDNDRRFATLFILFAGMAILIACLGLFGLASFTAQQRTKEIGVRKVLGATTTSLVALQSTDFLKLVLVASCLASPVAYFMLQRWLEGFAYHIPLKAGFFLLSAVSALVIALATVSYQAVRTALTNPARSLRYE